MIGVVMGTARDGREIPEGCWLLPRVDGMGWW